MVWEERRFLDDVVGFLHELPLELHEDHEGQSRLEQSAIDAVLRQYFSFLPIAFFTLSK